MNKVKLRKLWFQIHKWLGLVLAMLIIPICVTGAALVWHDPLEKWVYPQRFAVSGPATLGPERYADAARATLLPGERLTRLMIPGGAGEPVEAWSVEPATGEGRPERSRIFLDPADARLIEKHRISSGIFQIMHVIHGSLMVPGAGRQIVGWIGVAMTISSLTGLWLWWPIMGSVRRGFRWKRHPNIDTNLHYLLGFWISLPLFVLSVTGVWISFPSWFAGFDGPPRGAQGQGRAAMMRPRPLEMPATPLATAIERARSAARGDLRSVTFPTDAAPEWVIDLAAGTVKASVKVADADGVAKVTPQREQRETIARTMRRIHDGTGMPLWWQILVFLGGVLPAILAMTGIIMWWRARQWRAKVTKRRAVA
ncbi:PepSY-associated TM helix domain-containing protein [Sphingomonas turrisvirgatae]|uniref:Peptidase n=1 Tax=Sphingomonas turrisvirgatae TaxID=1888892 RepID=A0A1E3LTK3_9SPHN|nr:PepSY-associated TM helix domain-containing protein [Sphingomonas turrisvirgatae]ODP37088.1 peptidase [Sphingomonas turrisvirgatae]